MTSCRFASLLFFVLVILIYQPLPTDGLFSWLFRGRTDESKDLGEQGQTTIAKSKRDMALQTLKEVERSLVDFDLSSSSTEQQKYLSDASRKELEQLSSVVDQCRQLLVLKLTKSCGRMNEEELGKLSVRLLNCQLENEGRTTYECSDEMTLKECTTEMTPTVWNSYQIVGNRARGVCQATKQHQFRLKAEMAVNQLMHSTVSQLRAMDRISEGQEKLGVATAETIRRMYEGQEDLMSRQEMLKSSHSEVQESVVENLQALTKEKAMIASGNEALAKMTESIRQKLDQATQQLEEQRQDRATNHGEIVQDLALLRNKAKDVWDKIDANTKHLTTYHDQTADQYDKTLANLQRLNTTVSYILNSVQQLKRGLDARFGWLQTLVSSSHEQITVVYVIVLHSGYFLLSAILASFLQTELFTRTVIMVIVPLNCVAAVKHGVALDFVALSLFVLLIIAVHWLIHLLYAFISTAAVVRSVPSSSTGRKTSDPTAHAPSQHQHPAPMPHCHPTPIVPMKKTKTNEGLSRRDLAKIATALRDVLGERATSSCSRRRHSSSTPLDMSRDSALDASFLDDPTTFDCHTPMPDDSNAGTFTNATLTEENHNGNNVTETLLNQVKAKLLNNLNGGEGASPRRNCRSLPQSPARTPTKGAGGNTFMSLGVLTPSRMQCRSRTKAGKRCKSYCLQGHEVCRVHSGTGSDVMNSTSSTARLNLTYGGDVSSNVTYTTSGDSTILA